jgi:hypothetical protein
MSLCLGGLRQGPMHCTGFAGTQPDAAAWFSDKGGHPGCDSRNLPIRSLAASCPDGGST